jgi:hypothetical protein
VHRPTHFDRKTEINYSGNLRINGRIILKSKLLYGHDSSDPEYGDELRTSPDDEGCTHL